MVRVPLGFRFSPTDQEIIVDFLFRKIEGSLPETSYDDVMECDIYGDEEEWGRKFEDTDKKELYFFTKLKKKNDQKGKRVNRVTKSGTWKTSREEDIFYNGKTLIGSKRSFKFTPNTSTNTKNKNKKNNNNSTCNCNCSGAAKEQGWIMHEYKIEGRRLLEKIKDKENSNYYVLCRIKKEKEKKKEDTTNTTKNGCNNKKKKQQLQILEQAQEVVPYNINNTTTTTTTTNGGAISEDQIQIQQLEGGIGFGIHHHQNQNQVRNYDYDQEQQVLQAAASGAEQEVEAYDYNHYYEQMGRLYGYGYNGEAAAGTSTSTGGATTSSANLVAKTEYNNSNMINNNSETFEDEILGQLLGQNHDENLTTTSFNYMDWYEDDLLQLPDLVAAGAEAEAAAPQPQVLPDATYQQQIMTEQGAMNSNYMGGHGDDGAAGATTSSANLVAQTEYNNSNCNCNMITNNNSETFEDDRQNHDDLDQNHNNISCNYMDWYQDNLQLPEAAAISAAPQPQVLPYQQQMTESGSFDHDQENTMFTMEEIFGSDW